MIFLLRVFLVCVIMLIKEGGQIKAFIGHLSNRKSGGDILHVGTSESGLKVHDRQLAILLRQF